jgi:hypothetical protein
VEEEEEAEEGIRYHALTTINESMKNPKSLSVFPLSVPQVCKKTSL